MRQVLALAVLGCSTATVAAADVARDDKGLVGFMAEAERHWGLLDSYCLECHNFEEWAGGVAFDTMLPEEVPNEAAVWEQTVRKLRGRLMPPPGNPQPEQADIDQFVAWMEGYLDRAAASSPNPGHVPLHRLNRTEYARAVEGLLDVHLDISDFLPSETRSGGFDNIASALQVSPSFMDQYILAARYASQKALGDPSPARSSVVLSGGPGQNAHVEGLPLGTRGGMLVEHEFPADGEYEFVVRGGGFGASAGEHTPVLLLDGEPVALERGNRARVHVRAGRRQVGMTYLAKSFAESDAHLHAFNPMTGAGWPAGSVEVVGPIEPEGLSSIPSRERIFVCYPEAAAEEEACAQEIISTLTRRAYRGQVSENDLSLLMRFYQSGHALGGFERGIERAIMGILSSPKFLYRAAQIPADAVAGESYPLSDLELATRLAFFLWSQPPDEELIVLAEAGRLGEPDVIQTQVGRMLADPRSDSLVTSFAFNWLGIDEMESVNPDPNLYPHFNQALADAFVRELELFIGGVLREDRNVMELLTGDYSYLNERLALHYGISGVRGDRFRRVTLEDERRWGLLGKGAVLMATSFGNRTSPVVRGDWIMHNLMGTPPAPPPPGVETDLSEPASGERLTVRQLLEEHRAEASCNACHGVMDPLGLALENFDVTGEWRELDRYARMMIDAGGQLADGTPITGPVELRAALARNPEQFVQTMTEKLLMFALGRPLQYYDMPTVRTIVRSAAQEDYRFSSIVAGVVHSAPFRMRRVPEGDDAVEIRDISASR